MQIFCFLKLYFEEMIWFPVYILLEKNADNRSNNKVFLLPSRHIFLNLWLLLLQAMEFWVAAQFAILQGLSNFDYSVFAKKGGTFIIIPLFRDEIHSSRFTVIYWSNLKS